MDASRPQGMESVCSEILTQTLIETADKVFPIKNKALGKIPSPPWWDSDCTQAIKKRKNAEKNYTFSMTDENLEIYLQTARSTKKLLKQKKFDGWKRFCNSICPNVNSTIVWNNIKRFRCAFSENSYPKISHDIAEKCLDRLAPPYVPEMSCIYSPLPLHIQNSRTGLNSSFNLDELKGVLSHIKDSSPGEDGIPYSFIANLNDSSLSYYLDIINSIMISGNIPISWKTQEVILISKPNKPISEPSSFRPIVLSSVLVKIAERLVKNRLEWFIESNNLLSSSQFGFRKGKSTMDNLSIFVSDIRLAFSDNKSIIACFLDINAAYDNVIISILKEKLIRFKVPVMLTNFIINILSERFLTLILENNKKLTRTAWKGIPQGSVLSPLLYNIYTHDLETSLIGPFKILQYADDLLLYSVGHSTDYLSNSMSLTLSSLKTWLDNNGLELSICKSNIVLFTRMLRPISVKVFFNNSIIPVKTEVKFLGVTLDSKLTGTPHCNYVVSKCERNLNILKCLTGVWWGAHPFTMKIVYNSIIRSVLDYGTFLLEPGNVAGFQKLNIIQSKALRMVLGAMKTSPVNCLQVESVEPPLHLRRQYLADKFYARCLQYSNHPLLLLTSNLAEKLQVSNYWAHKNTPCLVQSYNRFHKIKAPIDKSSCLPLFKCKYEALINSPKVLLNFDIAKNDIYQNDSFQFLIDRDWPSHHLIYTDASKHNFNDCVGVGVFHSQYGIVQKIKLPPETSVFTGECFGLLKAVEYILLANLKNVVIFTDSLSSLQSLCKFPFNIKTQ